MTYDQLIEKVRIRGGKKLAGTEYWESGSVYEALNSSIVDLAIETKDYQRLGSLAITAGTQTYTISSTIDTDVDTILHIVTNSRIIEPQSVRNLQEKIFDDTGNDEAEASAVSTDESPDTFRVWAGILKFSKIPSTTETAQVYYTSKVAQSFYTAAIGATTVPIEDKYINAIIYEALAVLNESMGNGDGAGYFRNVSKEKLSEAMSNRVIYGNDDTIKYHDGVQ